MIEIKLCECGICKLEVKPGKKFIHGHHIISKNPMHDPNIAKKHGISMLGNQNGKGNNGKKHTLKTRNKISASLKGQIISQETRKKISIAGKGRIVTQQTRDKISIGRKGICHSLKSRMQMSETHKHRSQELIDRQTAARIGKLAGDKNPQWIDGRSYFPYCKHFNYSLKETVRNRDNRKCQNCMMDETQNGRKLPVHHIHYDKANCQPDLITLCDSCNAKANFNRDLWEPLYMNKLNDRGLLNWIDLYYFKL